MKLHDIIVTDGNGNDFVGQTYDPDAERVVAFTYVYGDNGFGVENGVVPLTGLKKLDDGKYGAA